MSINIVNYIQNKINQYDPNLDTREGSVLYDFLIGPLSVVLESYQQDHGSMMNTNSFQNIPNMPEFELDALGQKYFLSRDPGSKATGNVYLYFNESQKLYIPKGTYFVSKGVQYETSSDFFTEKFDMEANYDGIYYKAGPIQVTATAPGTVFNVPANNTFTTNALISSTPVKITNSESISSGVEKEDNETYFDRIKRTLYGSSLASPAAITSVIMNNFASVLDVVTIGAGHELMIRDIIHGYVESTTTRTDNFYSKYKNSNLSLGGYEVPHIAYEGIFVDTNSGQSLAIPPISNWTNEFTTDQYKGIYTKDDGAYTESLTKLLIDDNFSTFSATQQNGIFSMNTASGGFYYLHDGLNSKGIPDANTFSMSNNGLQLGQSVYQNDKVNEFKTEYDKQVALLEKKYDTPYKDFEGTQNKELNAFILQHISKSRKSNFAPIFHKPIDQTTGIQVLCDMKTTDKTEEGQMCYITTLRNNSIYAPHDGFGIAWRKQPEYLIRIANNTHTTADIDRFNYENNIAKGTALPNINFKTQGQQYWKYNIFLVDNDALSEDTWIGSEQIWDQTSGANQFLQAGKYWIESDITYNFTIKIYEYLGCEAWVGNTKVINRGQTYPPYVPIGYNENRNHFGVGVAETNNYEWYVSRLRVQSFIQNFSMHLFKFNVAAKNSTADGISLSAYNTSNPLTYNYYGVGFDPNTGNSSTKLAIYNPKKVNDVNGPWETLGGHTVAYNSSTNSNVFGISGTLTNWSDYVSSDYISLMAYADNTGPSYPNDTLHYLRSYYVQISNDNTLGIHRGNCTDIYCNDPDNIIEKTSGTYYIQNSCIEFEEDYQYLQEIVEVHDANSSIVYTRDNFYILHLSNSKYKIIFTSPEDLTDQAVNVVYRYWNIGNFVNNLVTNSDYRYPCADYQVKIIPPVVIEISDLKYSGGLVATDMKIKIAEYFNKLGSDTFDKSDLINLLYSYGANYVDLNMSITIREYDTFRNVVTTNLTAQSYTIAYDNIAKFYTHVTELYGVRQV